MIILTVSFLYLHGDGHVHAFSTPSLPARRSSSLAPVRVTLLDRRNHHLFQPLLYQVATATLSPGDIASPIRWILRRAGNLRVLMGEVERIDTGDRSEEHTSEIQSLMSISYDVFSLKKKSRTIRIKQDTIIN